MTAKIVTSQSKVGLVQHVRLSFFSGSLTLRKTGIIKVQISIKKKGLAVNGRAQKRRYFCSLVLLSVEHSMWYILKHKGS